MTNQQQYLQSRVRVGWGLLLTGIILLIVGLVLQFLIQVPFNARIISGLGIFITAVGFARIVHYRSVGSNKQAAVRLANAERDERMQMIRARAGSRGFWVSLAMTYTALMWLSFAGNGSLPTPSPDALWYYLSAAVVVPFIIYIVSITYDQNNS